MIVLFFPSFSEGNELNDCNKPSRIVIGSNLITSKNNEIAKLFSDIASNNPKFFTWVQMKQSLLNFSLIHIWQCELLFLMSLTLFQLKKALIKNVIEAVSYDKGLETIIIILLLVMVDIVYQKTLMN